MTNFRSLRAGTGWLALAVIMILATIYLSGCSESDPTTTEPAASEAPALPVAQQLQFDFSFFTPAKQLDKSNDDYDNFFNAYLRTVVLDAMAHLVLAAPLDAFSNAINTVPTAQPDGSWRWTYDWSFAGEPVGIVLIGLPAEEVVEWELRLVPQGSTREYLWFSGSTGDKGEQGHWEFLDLDDDDFPVCGEISWGPHEGGFFLEFVDRDPESDGGRLTFYDNDPQFRIEFIQSTGADVSFIQWNAAGDGSLMVPDYNEGLEACWDIYQRNVDCR